MEADRAAGPRLAIFESREEMASRLSSEIAARLARAIAETGRARLAVSGGSTPAALYSLLSGADLDWSRVTVVLVDERWVRPGEDGSNESFVSATLLQGKAAEARFVGLWSDTPFPRDAAAAAEHEINEASLLPFDVVVLGMGEDGHTASWFPCCFGINDALGDEKNVTHICANKSDVTGAYLDRLTLTLGAVESADFIALMIAGGAKRAAFEEACGDGAVEDMPVRAILRARPDLWACWAP